MSEEKVTQEEINELMNEAMTENSITCPECGEIMEVEDVKCPGCDWENPLVKKGLV